MLLVRWIGVRGALLFDALTFLLSAVSEMLLTPISGVQKKPKEKKNIFRDIAEGFAYLIRERQPVSPSPVSAAPLIFPFASDFEAVLASSLLQICV